MIVMRYIGRMLVIRLLISLLALSALLQVLDLFDNARDLLSRGGGTQDILTYTGLRFPTIIEQALPIAFLVWTLATLMSLARSNEMLALRSAGYTTYRILAVCLPIAIVSGIIHFILIDQVTPWSERRFLDWWSAFDAENPSQDNQADIWLRSLNSVVLVRGLSEAGQALNHVTIVQLSDNGLATGWIDAESAKRLPEGWVLYDTRTTKIENGRVAVESSDRLPWPGVLDPSSIVDLASPTDSVSTARLRRILQGTWAGENSPSYYLTRLYHSYASPLASLLMLLLAAPAAYIIRRRGGTGRELGLGFALGMGYLVADGLFSAFGEAGVLPPLIAAWTAPILFALIGGSILLHYEER